MINATSVALGVMRYPTALLWGASCVPRSTGKKYDKRDLSKRRLLGRYAHTTCFYISPIMESNGSKYMKTDSPKTKSMCTNQMISLLFRIIILNYN